MKANELRIGNLLNYQTAEGDILTATIDWQDLKWLSEDEQGFNLVHNPILLTEDWLLKFGFKYSLKLDDFMFKDQNDIFEMQPYKKGFLNSVLWCDNEILQEIKYAHQLQNLYFSLTGEELSL
jgi:hypothetical protein